MPGISERGKHMPASPIRKLVPFAEAAKARGTKVYHLNIGQPDIETPRAFMEAIQKADLKVVSYSHSAGFESYRKKLAEYYRKLGADVNHEQFIVTAGASEALRFVFMSCFDEGDEIIIPEPFYANYLGFAIEAGLKIVPIGTRIEDDFDLPGIETFEKLITPKTKAIMICNPGNPTGTMYKEEDLLKLREIVQKHDLYLVADEVYREFTYDDAEHISILTLDGIENNAIVVDSVSKRYSACGARVGCMVTRNEQVLATALKFAQARLSPPSLGQIGSEAMVDLPEDYIEEVKAEYKARRDIMVKELEKLEGVVCPHVNGAFYAIVRLPIDDCDTFCQWMLESFSYEGATVMMAPASGFYATEGKGKDEVRLAYVLNQEDLAHAMKVLGEGLKAYPGRRVMEAQSARKSEG